MASSAQTYVENSSTCNTGNAREEQIEAMRDSDAPASATACRACGVRPNEHFSEVRVVGSLAPTLTPVHPYLFSPRASIW